MINSDERRYERVSIGGAVNMYINDQFYSGGINNTSLGGILIESNTPLPEIKTGEKTDINILDMLSDDTHYFVTSVARSSDDGLALKFSKAFSFEHRQFIEGWLEVLN